jgi:hypothetical protein
MGPHHDTPEERTSSPPAGYLADLFRRRPVLQMSAIQRAVVPRSQRSVFRDLRRVGYLSSYTHTGRYYTLRSIPQFDADGLWRFEGIGFSRDGTLKATVHRLVETSAAGRTQRELQLRLEVRVHNPLLQLVEHRMLRRESLADEYVYLAATRSRATRQFAQRRTLPAARPMLALEVEVLLEVIHGVRLTPPDAATVAVRLAARGIAAGVAEVEDVLRRHGLKKTPRSRSRRSSR